MWNSKRVQEYEGMIAETVGITGHDGKPIRAYYSRPLGTDRFPGIVLIPHMPGWDEWCREACFRFSNHGYSVLCPDIYQDFGFGTPPEVSARMREAGLVQSLSGTGHCYDNARMESFFATLKKEKIYRIAAYKLTRDQVKSIVFRYVFVYYNRVRITTVNPGGLPPVEYREWAKKNTHPAA